MNPYTSLPLSDAKSEDVKQASESKKQELNPTYQSPEDKNLAALNALTQSYEQERMQDYQQNKGSWFGEEALRNGDVSSVLGNNALGFGSALTEIPGIFANAGINAATASQLGLVDQEALNSFNKKAVIQSADRKLAKLREDLIKEAGLDKPVTGIGKLQRESALMAIDDQVAQARQELNLPELTDKDNEILNRMVETGSNPGYQTKTSTAIGSRKKSQFDILDDALGKMKTAEDIDAFFEDNWFANRQNSALKDDIGDDVSDSFTQLLTNLDNSKSTGDKAKAWAGAVLDFAGDAASNPLASLEYATESLPSAMLAFINPALLGAESVGRGLDVYRENIKNHMDENNGQLPTKEKLTEYLQEAAVYMGADALGDAAIFKNLKKVLPKGKKADTEAPKKAETTDDAEQDITARQFAANRGKDALRIAGTAAIETGTEGVQTAIENDAFGQDFDLREDGLEVAQGAVAGFGAGTAISSLAPAGGAIAEGIDAANQVADQQLKERNEKAQAQKKKLREDLDRAESTGTMDKFVKKPLDDVENFREFDLDQRLNIIADRFTEVMADEGNENQKAEANEKYEVYSDAFDAALTQYGELTEKLKNKELTGDKAKQATRRIRQLDKVIGVAEKQLDKMEGSLTTLADTDAIVSSVTEGTDDTEVTNSANEAVKLMAVNSDAFLDTQIEQMINSGNLTEPQQNQLQSTLALKQQQAAMNASSSLEKVAKDVFKGRRASKQFQGFKGIETYRKAIARAVKKGDQAGITANRAGLSTFALRQNAKAKLFAKAFAPMLRSMEEGTALNPTAEETAAHNQIKSQYKGYNLWQPQANTLVEQVQAEAKALTLAVNEADALIANGESLSTPTPTVQPTAAPQATATPEPSTESTEQPTTPESAPETPTVETTPEVSASEPEAEAVQTKVATAPDGEASVAEESTPDVVTPDADVNTDPTPQERADSLKNEIDTLDAQLADNSSKSFFKAAAAELEIGEGTQDKATNRKVTERAKALRKQARAKRKALGKEYTQALKELATEESARIDSSFSEDSDAYQQELKDTKASVLEMESELAELEEEANNPDAIRLAALTNTGLPADESEYSKEDKNALRTAIRGQKQQYESSINSLKDEIAAAKQKLRALNGLASEKGAAQELLEANETLSAENGEANLVFNKWFKASGVKTLISHTANLLGRLKIAPEIAQTFLADDTSLTIDQQNAIKSFTDFAENFKGNLNSLFKGAVVDPETGELNTKNLAYKYKNLYTFLGGRGKLSERASLAMSAVAYQFLVNDSEDLAFPSRRTIAAMLGINEAAVSNQMVAEHKNRGNTMNFYAPNLGRQVLDALGLIPDNDVAPANQVEDMYTSVGLHVIAGLVDAGFLNVTSEEIKEYDDDGNFVGITTERFIKPALKQGAQRTDEPFIDPIQSIINVNKKSEKIIEQLFASEENKTTPLFRPNTNTTTKYKKTSRDLSPEIIEKVNHAENQSWEIAETSSVMDVFTEGTQEKIIGVVDEADMTNYRPDLKDSQEVRNRSLREELANVNEFKGTLLRKPKGLATKFFLRYEVYRNQRVGIKGTYINGQASKVQRGLTILSAWKKPVDMNNEKQMYLFKQAVAQGLEGFDKKSLAIDKFSKKTISRGFAELESNPEFVAAVAALKEILIAKRDGTAIQSNMTQMETDIANAVAKGGHTTHSLHSLVNYARYQIAQDTPGQTTFTSDAFTEIDGITNGVVMGILQFGNGTIANMKKLLRMGGVFFGSERSYSIFEGEMDLYIELGNNWSKYVKAFLSGKDLNEVKEDAENMAKAQKSIQTILGEIARSLAKDPLMTNSYGAGVPAILAKLTDTFFEKFDEKVAEAMDIPVEAERNKVLNELVKSMHQVTGRKIFGNKQDLLTKRFTPNDNQAVYAYLEEIYGKALKQALSHVTEGNKKQINAYNKSVNVFNSNFIHNIHTPLVEARKKEMMAAGLLRSGDELPANEIAKINKKAAALMPGIQSQFAQQATEQIQLAREERTDNKNVARASFKRPIDGYAKSSLTSTTYRKGWMRDLGVKAGVGLIHSLDATVSINTLGSLPVLNVHDGFPIGALDVETGGKQVNETFYNTMKTNSAYGRMRTYYEDALAALDDLEGELGYRHYNAAKKQINKALASMRSLDEDYRSTFDQVIKDITYVTQYNVEDGGYEPNPVENKGAQPLSSQDIRNELAELEKLNITFDSLGEYVSAQDYKPNAFTETIREILATTDNAKEFVSRLAKSKIGKTNRYNIQLLREMYPLINANTKIKLIDPDTKGDERNAMRGANGSYHLDADTLYITSDFYKNSGMKPETLAHEMLHALTSRGLRAYEKGKKSPAMKAAVDDLTRLMDQVKRAATAANINQNIPPFKDMHEFITYGLTNSSMIRLLQTTEVESAGTKKLTNAFKRFMRNVLKLAFQGRPVADTSAYAELVRVTSNIAQVQSEMNAIASNNLDPDVKLHTAERMDTEQLFDGLNDGNTTQEHENHLRQTINNIVDKVGGIEGHRLAEAEEVVGDEVDQYIQHIANKTNPFISKVSSMFGLSQQEQFVGELLEVALDNQFAVSNQNLKELNKIWKEAGKLLSPTDFLPDPAYVDDADEMALATKRYNYLFNPQVTKVETEYDPSAGKDVIKQRSDYLKRFAVAMQVHAPLRAAIESKEVTADARVENTDSILKRIGQIVEYAINALRNYLEQTIKPSGAYPDQVEDLLTNMAVIQSNQRRRVADLLSAGENQVDKVDDYLGKQMRKAMNKAADANGERISGVGGLLRVVAADKAEALIDTLYRFNESYGETGHGFGMNMVQEFAGITSNNKVFMRLLRWANRGEQMTRKVKEWTGQQIIDGFNTKVSRKEESALTKVFVKTDLSVFLETLDPESIMRLVTDSRYLQQQIDATLSELNDHPHKKYFNNQAKSLGYYLAKGEATHDSMFKNAGLIASLAGTSKQDQAVDVEQATNAIDRLASLYGLMYTKGGDVAQAKRLIEREQANGGLEGLKQMLYQHSALKREAELRLFQDESALMEKGFIPEITNPHITLKFAAVGSEEYSDLLKQGFKPKFDTSKSIIDLNRNKVSALVKEDGGMKRYITGIMQLNDNQRKGTNFEDAAFYGNEPMSNTEYVGQVSKLKASQTDIADALFDEDFDPELEGDTHLIPVVNPKGEVVSFRYQMNEELRSTLLEKEYAVSQVLGAMASGISGKTESKQINAQVIDAMYDQYSNDNRVESYIAISPENAEPELKQIWDMLPRDAKEYARRKFGRNAIMVKKELATLVFGYRKASAENIWKNPETNNMVQNALKMALEAVIPERFHAKLPGKIRKIEDIVEAVVATVKDIIVVKTVFVTAANMISNTALLAWQGVPITDVFKDQAIAWRSAQKYNKDQQELYKAQQSLAALPLGDARRKVFSKRVVLLQNQLASSPVAKLMDAGLFQTIVEDIDSSIDQYSYKHKFVKSIDATVDRFPSWLKTGGKNALITQDTKLYKLLNHPIQLSDFSARYALYKNMVDKGVNADSAIDSVSEAFVNYDVPTHRGLQYANDVGLMMFTKYFIRIQKVIFNLLLDKPARSLMMLVSQGMFGLPTPIDSMLFYANPLDKIYNPLSTAIGAPDEIATINFVLHLLGIK